MHCAVPAVRLSCLIVLLGFGSLASAQTPRQWHLAEGATGAFFQEDILIANPNATAAQIRITYLKPGGAQVEQTFTMPAASRRTVQVNRVAGLENTSVSAIVRCTNGLDIVVERTMYWADGRGGHNSPGVMAPAERWVLAEGATGFFDNYVLIANPDPLVDAAVRLTFLRTDGTTATRNVTVPAGSRHTVWTNTLPGLANAAFSTVVESTNGTGIIAERAMYWNKYEGGHDSVGITAPSASWFFAEGFTGGSGAMQFETYLLLANPGTQTAAVRVTFLRDVGAPVVRTYDLPPTSRLNVAVDLIAGLENAAFSARVESTNAVPIVAERAVYWGPGGADGWVDGTNTPGLTTLSPKWGFAEGAEDLVYNVPFDAYFLIANPNASALSLKATFYLEGGGGIVRTFTVPAQARFTIPTSQFPELRGRQFAAFFESTNSISFAAERAMYWLPGYAGGHASTGVPWTGAIAAPSGASPPPPPPPPPPSAYPTDGPGIVTYVANRWSSYRAATSTVDQRIRNMEFLRDRVIEIGKCVGLDLAYNLKRGVGPRSTDALAWRTNGVVEVVDIGIAYDDNTRTLQMAWQIVAGPPGYDPYPGNTCP